MVPAGCCTCAPTLPEVFRAFDNFDKISTFLKIKTFKCIIPTICNKSVFTKVHHNYMFNLIFMFGICPCTTHYERKYFSRINKIMCIVWLIILIYLLLSWFPLIRRPIQGENFLEYAPPSSYAMLVFSFYFRKFILICTSRSEQFITQKNKGKRYDIKIPS